MNAQPATRAASSELLLRASVAFLARRRFATLGGGVFVAAVAACAFYSVVGAELGFAVNAHLT